MKDYWASFPGTQKLSIHPQKSMPIMQKCCSQSLLGPCLGYSLVFIERIVPETVQDEHGRVGGLDRSWCAPVFRVSVIYKERNACKKVGYHTKRVSFIPKACLKYFSVSLGALLGDLVHRHAKSQQGMLVLTMSKGGDGFANGAEHVRGVHGAI
jgi:hypothetical protein